MLCHADDRCQLAPFQTQFAESVEWHFMKNTRYRLVRKQAQAETTLTDLQG